MDELNYGDVLSHYAAVISDLSDDIATVKRNLLEQREFIAGQWVGVSYDTFETKMSEYDIQINNVLEALSVALSNVSIVNSAWQQEQEELAKLEASVMDIVASKTIESK